MKDTKHRFETWAYVSHPYGGKDENIDATGKIIREFQKDKNNKNILFVSPLHAFSYVRYKNNEYLACESTRYGLTIEDSYTGYTDDYINGMKMCFDLLDECDEIWLTGEWFSSSGCLLELAYAAKKGIPIVVVDNEENIGFINESMNLNLTRVINDESNRPYYFSSMYTTVSTYGGTVYPSTTIIANDNAN